MGRGPSGDLSLGIMSTQTGAPVWTVDTLGYPAELPVVARREDLLEAIRDHQVVVVAGETGSGKTTQLPKMCLELGRGRPGETGQIAHTQPRRIAARSVAERIAEELGVELGGAVGYQVRFTDHSSDATAVKVMTDGILLNEMQRDRDLRRYDTIIIDEAHERSLNIDFILGYLAALLPRRPDLKVVITSATIDPARFARHFGRGDVPAPVVEVSGRTHPVEVRYRPLVDPDDPATADRDQVTGICDAVAELWTESARGGPEDILVFLSGEREIRDAADALAGMGLPQTEVLPLYARLSTAEQHRVFRRSGMRRIVLATNVAETSLTVPGIRYVIDTGTARISRYSQRTKVQRLPIEPISQASAAQRSGRCGRLADGIAIRLYSEDDFDARPDFTEPEILRTSLASVILQMTALGLGDVRRFPFIDPPDARQVADGTRLLEELEAFAPEVQEAPADARPGRGRGRRGSGRRLTRIGRTLARMPVDPRLGRMLIAADELGCTAEVLVVVAGLSIQDPRERPADAQAQADQAHARFKDKDSDFVSWLNLWRHVKEQQKALSGSAFRRMCKAEHLHYLRIREWQDLHAQLRQAARSQGLDPGRRTGSDGAFDTERLHRALLTGLLSHVGLRDELRRDYLGARGAHFHIQPGSALFRRQPDLVMSAELVETTRLWARTNAAIDPTWAEEAGAHVVKRSYSEPRWSRDQGAALATERVTLYGVPLVADRTVQYGRIAPEEARELFVRRALVEGDWEGDHAFFRANTEMLRRLANLEERARRRDLVVDDDVLHDFYDERIPADVTSARHFDAWWKGESRQRPRLLHFTEDLVRRGEAEGVSGAEFPGRWRQGDLDLRLSYEFDPGSDADGVTVHIPLPVLNQVDDEGFDWLVPGLREDLAVAHIRALPKAVRRHLVPAPDVARAALSGVGEPDGRSFAAAFTAALRARTGVAVDPGDLDVARLPRHLRMTFAVDGARGHVLDSDTDLDALRDRLAGQVQRRMSTAAAAVERTGMTTWDVEEVPLTFTSRVGRLDVVGHPALVDRGTHVDLRVLPDAASATAANRLGVRRLLLLATNPPWKRVLADLSNAEKLALGDNPHGSVPALLDDCLAAAVDALVAEHTSGDPVRGRAAFEEVLAHVRVHVAARVLRVVRLVEPILRRTREVRGRVDAAAASSAPTMRVTVADVRAQVDSLVGPGFVAATGEAHLGDLDRYLRAVLVRLDRAPTNAREDVLQASIDRVETAFADLLEAGADPGTDVVRDLARQVEELRVGLFAQSLGTPRPVSEKRVLAAIRAATP